MTMTKNKKLKLFAETIKDLKVISTLCQDSVGVTSNMKWHRKDKIFSMIINRMMWEATQENISNGDSPLRSQSILLFRWINSVKSRGFSPKDGSKYFSLLNISYDELKSSNQVRLIFSVGLEIILEVEYLEVFLQDISNAYPSKTEKLPRHEI